MEPIPAIWRIDVEPDEHEVRPASNPPPWSGFVALAALVERLRPRLADVSGAVVHPAWFLRLDPIIERCFGRAHFVVERYPDLMDQLRAYGDPMGIHVHFHRWDERRQVTYSDHADTDWIGYCVKMAAKTFKQCFGEPVRRSSQGGYFLDDAVVNRVLAADIEVDVTPEPGLAPSSDDPSFGAYATAPSPDFRDFPRRPYFPSRDALGVPARSSGDARPLLIVPLTAYDYQTALTSWPRRLAKRVMRRPRQHLPLNPWKVWSHPRTYWDLVARAADEGPARYIAFAMRSDNPTSNGYRRAREIVEYLPKHPIARRLRFVDPLSPEIRALAKEGNAPRAGM
jgi:hypothetical protein